MSNARMTRRTMLRGMAALGAGGTVLSGAFGQLAAHAAGDAAAVVRRRVVFVLQTNGMNPAHLVPVGLKRRPDGRNEMPDNAATEELSLRDKALHPALEPLTAFKDRMALVQGLSGRVALSDHSTNQGALGCYPGKGPAGPTIDAILSCALPAGTFRHVALGYGGNTVDPMNYSYCVSAPGVAMPIITSPDLAYRSLFGSVADGAGRKAFDRRTNLLDFMADDVRRSRAALAGEERAKFDQYVDAFESLHARQKELIAKEEALKRNAPQLGEKQRTSMASLTVEAQFETAAAALVAGLTNVMTITSGGGSQRFGSFPEFGMPDLHGVGHGNAYGRASSEDCFVELRRFHTTQIARLCAKLAAVREGDGTMLDHTLIVYLSDSGEGHHPRLLEWPVVLIGDMGGKLKTGGRYVQLPAYKQRAHRTMANLYCTLLHAAGAPRDKFGVPDPSLKDVDQSGVVAELLA